MLLKKEEQTDENFKEENSCQLRYIHTFFVFLENVTYSHSMLIEDAVICIHGNVI